MYSGLCGLCGLGLTVLMLWPIVVLTHGADKSARPAPPARPPFQYSQYLSCPFSTSAVRAILHSILRLLRH